MLETNDVCYYIECILRVPVFCLDDKGIPMAVGEPHDDSVLELFQTLQEEDYSYLRRSGISLRQTKKGAFWGGVNSQDRLYLIGPTGFDSVHSSDAVYRTDYRKIRCLAPDFA